MQEINTCNFCGSSEACPLFTGSDLMFLRNTSKHTVLICSQCGLFYLSPRPFTPEELAAIYPPEYEPYVDPNRKLMLRLRQLAWRSELLDIVRVGGKDAYILEIGCATGEYLDALHELGCERLAGLEFNPQVAQLARERYGLDVTAGELMDAQYPDQTFDIVVMRHVFEHVPDPMGTLREIARILKPGGQYIFVIPNPDSLDAKVFGRYWQGHDIPRHFYNYPPGTLKQMLSEAGLEQQDIRFSLIPNDWILSIKRMLLEHGWPGWVARLFEIDNPILLALFTPVSILAGLVKRSGRIRVRAAKV